MNETQKRERNYVVQSIWYDLAENFDESYAGEHNWESNGMVFDNPRGWYWIIKWDKYYTRGGGKQEILDELFMDKTIYNWKQDYKNKEEQRNPYFGKSYEDEIKDLRLDMWDVVKDHPFIVELMDLIKKYESQFDENED